MFNSKKKIAAEYRSKAIAHLAAELPNSGTYVDYGALLGAAELAFSLGLITDKERTMFRQEAFTTHQTYLKEHAEQRARLSAERKAERAAKAKAAKGNLANE